MMLRTNTRGFVALKYHPDRNPGHETEYIPKFQAIQSAHEILTDSTQRAKYDADRLRTGTFYPYSSPTRPNVPPRSPATNFPPPPPPPRPPPPTTTKTSHPASSSGTNRYSQYAKFETANSRTNANVDDNQTKANAFKAWEQMRHGTGPVPTSRVPPRATKPTFPTRPTPNGATDDSTPPRRTAYEQFQEFQNTPRMSRANTTRVPKKTAFAAGTFAGDETPAQKKAPYSGVPRSERPPRANPSFAVPPPAGHRKPDPLQPFKPHTGPDGQFTNSERISTPYATAGGERTYFSSHGLQRPTSNERRGSAERYDMDPSSRDTSHSRPPSTPADRQHHSASPKMRTPKQRVPISSSSSSTSSSDEAEKFTQRPFGTRRKPLRKPTEGKPRSSMRPSVKVDAAPEADTAQPPPPGPRNTWGDGDRNQQVPERANTDLPEGFLQHRLKRESQRMDPSQRGGSATRGPTNSAQPQHPLQRPKSWNEHYGPSRNGQNLGSDSRPQTEGRTDKEPMYETPGYTPFPFTPARKWSDQWTSMSSNSPRTSSGRFPYWAIPSSLPPLGQPKNQHMLGKDNLPCFAEASDDDGFSDADLTPKSSFKFPTYDAKKPFDGKPPLRSHSSESINTNFSPSHWNGRFTSGQDYSIPPTSTKSDTANVGPAADQARAMPPPPPPRQNATQTSSSAPTTSIPPISAQGPPPPNPINLTKEEWAQHFKPPSWSFPPPPKASSPIRSANRKRPGQPQKVPRVPSKRPQPARVSAAANGAEDGTGTASVESVSSRTSGDESAMDVDPVLTPPSGPSSGERKSSAQTDQTSRSDRLRSGGPPVPPRVNGQPVNDAEHIYVSDLKNVAPFVPSAEGLKDLNDLKTTLPFESQPSKKPPTDLEPQLLELPNPPKAPAAPPQSSWSRYIAQMKVYMFEWNEFNSKMLAHFTERQSNIGNTLTGDWMSAQGDQGYQQYMQGIEEDFRVRAHWDVSWEKHRECMKNLGSVREKVYPRKV